MSASPRLQEAARKLVVLVEGHWSRFAAYLPPDGPHPALYCPYTAIALATGGPVPGQDAPAPENYDRTRPWLPLSIVDIVAHCRSNAEARELTARFYAHARRSGEPRFFDYQRPEYELIGVWNAHNETNVRPLEIARKIANRLI